MNPLGFVLAYHGCDKAVAERVLSGETHVRTSKNDYDWLGPGAYFWENSPKRALTWAKFLCDHPTYSRHPVKDPAVIGAILIPGRCLDLTDSGSLTILKDAYQAFATAMKSAGTPLPQNQKGHAGDADLVRRHLDCSVIKFLHDLRSEEKLPPFETLRGAFFEGPPLYHGAGFAEKTHIQWCVPEPKRNVRGYFRVLPGWDQ